MRTFAAQSAALWADYQCLAWWVSLWTSIWGLFLTMLRLGVIRWGTVRTTTTTKGTHHA